MACATVFKYYTNGNQKKRAYFQEISITRRPLSVVRMSYVVCGMSHMEFLQGLMNRTNSATGNQQPGH
jgi:hypothetical protein